MHMRERSRRVLKAVVGIGRFLRRHKKAALALLLVGPLLTGAGYEVFVLNAIGLGIGALFVRGQVLRRRDARLHRQRRRTPGDGGVPAERPTEVAHRRGQRHQLGDRSSWEVRRVTRHRIPDPIGRNSKEVSGSTDLPRSESLGGTTACR